MRRKLVICLWVLVLGSLFLYSFMQIDLGLTFARSPLLQSILRSFQYIGWFNRPLSTIIYCLLVSLLFVLYCWTLFLVRHKKIHAQTVWVIAILAGVILLFSYNAFSYDLFNYIFDAKIVTHYNQNPYQHKALDYPEDPMLGFMRWTHRTYPYGPLWLGISIPLSYLGLGYFLITLYLFKLLAVLSYFVSGWFIFKIAKKTKLTDPVLALAFFALNPLVLVESLVSAHIDVVMVMLGMLATYMMIDSRKAASWILLIASILVKFATALLIPLFLWYPFSKRKNKNVLFFLLATMLMIGGAYLQVVLATKTFQVWYFLLVIPYAALLVNKYYVSVPVVIFSFLVLFQYVPYLYSGNYDPPIPQIMIQMLLGSIGISIIPVIVLAYIRRQKK